MLVIGEKINVISNTLGTAMKERDKKPIQDIALRQAEAGANMLDLNIGPATKDGPERMEWVVETVQEVLPDMRLSLDTINPVAMEAGLKLCRNRPMINSTSAERARLETFLPMAHTYEADIIALTMTEAGVSRDCDERVMAAADIMAAMMEFDVPLERAYLDPLLLPICVAQQQAVEAMNAIAMFKELNDPPLKTVVGLSNIYNGCPEEVKSALAATLLTMLAVKGLDAAIMDPLDEALMTVVKTVDVFNNETLYCHSYLD